MSQNAQIFWYYYSVSHIWVLFPNLKVTPNNFCLSIHLFAWNMHPSCQNKTLRLYVSPKHRWNTFIWFICSISIFLHSLIETTGDGTEARHESTGDILNFVSIFKHFPPLFFLVHKLQDSFNPIMVKPISSRPDIGCKLIQVNSHSHSAAS